MMSDGAAPRAVERPSTSVTTQPIVDYHPACERFSRASQALWRRISHAAGGASLPPTPAATALTIWRRVCGPAGRSATVWHCWSAASLAVTRDHTTATDCRNAAVIQLQGGSRRPPLRVRSRSWTGWCSGMGAAGRRRAGLGAEPPGGGGERDRVLILWPAAKILAGAKIDPPVTASASSPETWAYSRSEPPRPMAGPAHSARWRAELDPLGGQPLHFVGNVLLLEPPTPLLRQPRDGEPDCRPQVLARPPLNVPDRRAMSKPRCWRRCSGS